MACMQNAVSITRPRIQLKSSAQPVECYVCGRGLEDGFSVTAKALRTGTAMFCNIHYGMQ